jgi:hypothetical protein
MNIYNDAKDEDEMMNGRMESVTIINNIQKSSGMVILYCFNAFFKTSKSSISVKLEGNEFHSFEAKYFREFF